MSHHFIDHLTSCICPNSPLLSSTAPRFIKKRCRDPLQTTANQRKYEGISQIKGYYASTERKVKDSRDQRRISRLNRQRIVDYWNYTNKSINGWTLVMPVDEILNENLITEEEGRRLAEEIIPEEDNSTDSDDDRPRVRMKKETAEARRNAIKYFYLHIYGAPPVSEFKELCISKRYYEASLNR